MIVVHVRGIKCQVDEQRLTEAHSRWLAEYATELPVAERGRIVEAAIAGDANATTWLARLAHSSVGLPLIGGAVIARDAPSSMPDSIIEAIRAAGR